MPILTDLEKATALSIEKHAGLTKEEAILADASVLMPLHHKVLSALDLFLDAVASVGLQQKGFRGELDILKAIEKSSEIREEYSDLFGDS